MKKFYITTAIDYVNAEPHIGHAYQKIIADVLARWYRLKGYDVFFLTGTDEHGLKISQAAKQKNIKEKKFVNEVSKKFKNAWGALSISYDRFIRTTDKNHKIFVQNFIKKIKKDIYKGSYFGLYCVDCERFYTEKDLVSGRCQFHPEKKLELLEEETYYFKLSKYKKKLLKLYKNEKFILPNERRNEIVSRVKESLQDLSISRKNFKWGVPFPLDPRHVVYVWFDALLSYISGAGKKQEFWPANLQLLGKDNGWFHAVIWPAMLISAGYKLPRTVFIHGFLTFDGKKISKSLGNVISPNYLVDKYGADSVRYFICRNFVFGEDGNFSEEKLKERHNNELADKLGNLVLRITSLAERELLNTNGVKTENKLLKKLNLNNIEKNIEDFKFDKTLNEIFSFIDFCNEYIQKNRIWESRDKGQIYEVLDSVKTIAILLWPFIPETSEKIAKNLRFKINLKEINQPLKVKNIKKSEILFKKL